MKSVIETLTASLPRDTRDLVMVRYNALDRQLAYLSEKKDRHITLAYKSGWSIKRIKIILALNSFYQIVLSPLASSAREFNRISPLSDIDIIYGQSFQCDAAWRLKISNADSYFHEILNQMGINRFWLIQQKTEDVIYQLGKKSK